MATRQNSSSGKPKSPRIQVVLPEDLWRELNLLASEDSRTISNMAKVLIQEGVHKRLTSKQKSDCLQEHQLSNTEQILSSLENQQTRRLRGLPRKFKLHKP
tara:strand:+ start:31 stop:333 length:303 start_codon:yes stop_codon:yes gene_type:complete